MNYILEYRDQKDQWHRPRLPKYISAAFAIRQGARLANNTYTRSTGYRVVNADSRMIEYTEILARP